MINNQFNTADFIMCMNEEYAQNARSGIYLKGLNAVLDCNDSSLAYAVATRVSGLTDEELHRLVDIVLLGKNSLNIYNIACKPFMTEEEKNKAAKSIVALGNIDHVTKFIRNVKDCPSEAKDVLIDAVLATKSQYTILNCVESCSSALDKANLEKIVNSVLVNEYIKVAEIMLNYDGGQTVNDSIIDCIINGEDVSSNAQLVKRMWQSASPTMRQNIMSALFENKNWKSESLQSFLAYRLTSDELGYLVKNIKLSNCIFILISDQRLTPKQRTILIDRVIAEGVNMDIIVGSSMAELDKANLQPEDYHKIAKYLIKNNDIGVNWLTLKGFNNVDKCNLTTVFIRNAGNYVLKDLIKESNKNIPYEVRQRFLQEIINRYKAKKYSKLDLPDNLSALSKEYPQQALELAKLLDREDEVVRKTKSLESMITQLLSKNANAKADKASPKGSADSNTDILSR